MEVGRSAPRYQALALIYPRSRVLQAHINEYFIVVVRLCHRMMAFSQKSMFAKTTSALNDAELKSLQSELNLWSGLIKDEVDLLMAKKVEDEAEENSRFRAVSTRFSKSVDYRQKLRERLRMLDLFSTFDFETTWKQTRKTGNTQIFEQTPEYGRWKDSSESSTLCYTGKLGCGKIVMLANIVDDLTAHVEGTDAKVAYFFCRHDLPQSLDERTVIGALARQILRSEFDLFLEPTVANMTSFDSGELMSLAKRALTSNADIYIVLDGLYICNRSTTKQITTALHGLQSVRKVHICISYRLESNTASDIPELRNTIVVPQLNNEPEIEAFIEAELERCLASRTLVLGNPALILDIQDALVKGSQGMFLWATLQIHFLCGMWTDVEIRKALTDLPHDLTHIYRQILEQSQLPGRSYCAEIFKFVIAAIRPLTIHEMQEALSVTPDYTVWDPSKLLNDVYPALATCGCLIIVDEEERTVRTVHPSVDKFILTENSATRPESFYTPMDAAQTLMTSTIATYLSYGVFGTQLSTRPPALEVGPVPHDIIKSVTSTTRGVQSIALKLLKFRKKSNFDAADSIAGFRTQRPLEVRDFHFYDYAKTHALQHVAASFRHSSDTVIALYQLLDRGMIQINSMEDVYAQLCLALLPGSNPKDIRALVYQIIDDMPASLDRAQLFFLAIEKGRIDVVKHLLGAYRMSIEEDIAKLRTPADAASSDSFDRWLQDVDSTDEVRRHCIGPAPLCHAIKEHQNSIVSILIDSALIDINARSDSLEMPIGVAVIEQNFHALELLLSKCPKELLPNLKMALIPYIATNNRLSIEAFSILERYGF
jgi:hypothetical protein